MEIKQSVALAPYTTFGIGGPADFFVVVNSALELEEAVGFARRNSLNFFVLGLGANILVGDKGFRGLVIKNEARRHFASGLSSVEKILFKVESGCVISDLTEITSSQGLSGFEHFAGIPSTIGGALWQNLHFLSPDRHSTVFIGDLVDSAEVLLENGGVKSVEKSFFQFGYDSSLLHKTKDVVLSASFKLQKEKPVVIKDRIRNNLEWRKEKHPEYAWRSSAGSVFKKIENFGAGRLIEQVGLKGFSVGGAKISEKHANFIINSESATAKDVKSLISIAQTKVKEELGLELQTEISFIGEF